MLSIGQLATRTDTKVPTIRYYEQVGLLSEPERTSGGQRRYDQRALDRLGFVRHARSLGFSLQDIAGLLSMESCEDPHAIAARQLAATRERIARLTRLEAELARIATACEGGRDPERCGVLAALGDHAACDGPHGAREAGDIPARRG